MSRVITFSRVFPAYHPKKGQPTHFVEKLVISLNIESKPLNPQPFNPPLDFSVEWNPKHHTIRGGHRWKVGDKFSPRVWSGKPYNSKMITIAPDIEIKKVWDFKIDEGKGYINGELVAFETAWRLATNDGLASDDFNAWFQYPKPFDGQIICWNESINY